MQLVDFFHDVKQGTPEEKRAFWEICKNVASNDPGGTSIGLTKVAFEIWADAYERGLEPIQNQEMREAFASSFGSAFVVENAITKMASAGMISEDEQNKMVGWVAESSIQDLNELTKTSATALEILRKPQVIGALSGLAIGAGVGAWKDNENRARGAITGAVPGALIGATLGQGVKFLQGTKAEDIARQAFKTEKDRGMGAAGVDAFKRVANLWSDPKLIKVVEDNADKIREHVAAGHTHLPEFIEQHLPTFDQRTLFMKRLHQYLPKMGKTSSIHDKLADVMQGLENGGQPPMNANGMMPPQSPVPPEAMRQSGLQPPPGSLEGGQEGMPPSTDPNAQAGEAIAEPQIGDGSLDGMEKGHKTIDNMIFLAKQVQLPQLAQELEQNRDALAEHFAAGNAYLPPELQHHFSQSEHAEAFMKKYKQRFGSVGGGGQKKTALFGFGKKPQLPELPPEHKIELSDPVPEHKPQIHEFLANYQRAMQAPIQLTEESLSNITPEQAHHLLSLPMNYDDNTYNHLSGLADLHNMTNMAYSALGKKSSPKTAGILDFLRIKHHPPGLRGLDINGIPSDTEMEQMRPYLNKADQKSFEDAITQYNAIHKKTAGILEGVYQLGDRVLGRAPGGVDMNEVRKRLPGAIYQPKIPVQGKTQPGFIVNSPEGSYTSTWDPATVRATRHGDPKGFYNAMVQGAPGAIIEQPKVAEENMNDPVNQLANLALGRTKAAEENPVTTLEGLIKKAEEKVQKKFMKKQAKLMRKQAEGGEECTHMKAKKKANYCPSCGKGMK